MNRALARTLNRASALKLARGEQDPQPRSEPRSRQAQLETESGSVFGSRFPTCRRPVEWAAAAMTFSSSRAAAAERRAISGHFIHQNHSVLVTEAYAGRRLKPKPPDHLLVENDASSTIGSWFVLQLKIPNLTLIQPGPNGADYSESSFFWGGPQLSVGSKIHTVTDLREINLNTSAVSRTRCKLKKRY